MRAAVVRELGAPLNIEEIPVPTPGYRQVLVKVVASGVCHTDLHAAHGDWPVKPTLPLIPGHEGVGIVVALGQGVSNLHIGDKVGVPWLHSVCGSCECCITGWETLCASAAYTGYTVSGGFADYTLAEASHAGRIPEGLDLFEAAPVLCAGVTTYKGIKETEAKPGEWVVISGVGGLGHLAVQYAKAMGLRVVAVDIADEKLAVAKQVGADAIVNVATEADSIAAVESVTNGGAHGVLITAPAVSAFKQGVGMTRRHGTCVLVGLPPGDFPTPIFDIVLKRITVRGSLVGTRQDLNEALRFAADGVILPQIERQPLEAINTVFERLEKGQVDGRIVLEL